jgi:hypothetical protein
VKALGVYLKKRSLWGGSPDPRATSWSRTTVLSPKFSDVGPPSWRRSGFQAGFFIEARP